MGCYNYKLEMRLLAQKEDWTCYFVHLGKANPSRPTPSDFQMILEDVRPSTTRYVDELGLVLRRKQN